MKLRACFIAAALVLSYGVALAITPVSSPQKKVFVKADAGFDTNIIAAFEKKHTPLTVVEDPAQADYILEATGVDTHTETTGSKVVRCLFADCIGMEGNSSVSVKLIDKSSGTIMWAYQVRKGFSGPQARQSLSEAIAKHLRNYLKGQAKKQDQATKQNAS